MVFLSLNKSNQSWLIIEKKKFFVCLLVKMAIEAFPPFIILTGCVAVTGLLLKNIDKLFNEGKVGM